MHFILFKGFCADKSRVLLNHGGGDDFIPDWIVSTTVGNTEGSGFSSVLRSYCVVLRCSPTVSSYSPDIRRFRERVRHTHTHTHKIKSRIGSV